MQYFLRTINCKHGGQKWWNWWNDSLAVNLWKYVKSPYVSTDFTIKVKLWKHTEIFCCHYVPRSPSYFQNTGWKNKCWRWMGIPHFSDNFVICKAYNQTYCESHLKSVLVSCNGCLCVSRTVLPVLTHWLQFSSPALFPRTPVKFG